MTDLVKTQITVMGKAGLEKLLRDIHYQPDATNVSIVGTQLLPALDLLEFALTCMESATLVSGAYLARFETVLNLLNRKRVDLRYNLNCYKESFYEKR